MTADDLAGCWIAGAHSLRLRAFALALRGRAATVMHELPIEDSIDLHTFQPREVEIVVDEYLFQAVQRGFGEVRIIHGRGIGVQREIIHSMLKKHPNVVSFRDAPDRGSTYVRLRGGSPPPASEGAQ